MDCQTAMGILAVGVLSISLMITIVLHYVLHRYTASDDYFMDDNSLSNYKKNDTSKWKNLRLEDQLVQLCWDYGKVNK